MSSSTVTSELGASDAKRFLDAPSASATVSISVFQAPQAGHFPSHLGLVLPQSVQTYSVLSLAI